MADKMTFAAVPANGDGEPVSVECEFEFGETLADAIELHGEEDIMYFFKRGTKGFLGMRARASIVGGSSPDQVQDLVANADLSKRGREKMTPFEKLMKQLGGLSEEERKSVIDKLK